MIDTSGLRSPCSGYSKMRVTPPVQGKTWSLSLALARVDGTDYAGLGPSLQKPAHGQRPEGSVVYVAWSPWSLCAGQLPPRPAACIPCWVCGQRCRAALLRAAPPLLRPMSCSPPSSLGPAQPAVLSRAYNQRQIMHSCQWCSLLLDLPSGPMVVPITSQLVKHALLTEADSMCCV
jgi:hypothetical protein